MLVKIRQLTLSDASYMLEWMQDYNVNKFFRFDPNIISLESVAQFIEKSISDSMNKHFAIASQYDEYMGTVSLKNLDMNAMTGEYAIVLRSCFQGVGAGKEATKWIIQYGFEELHLNKIYLNVISENTRAIRLYESLGFCLEGEFKEHVFVDGKLKNLKWYSMFKSNYPKEGSADNFV